jgi:hypothetical protein
MTSRGVTSNRCCAIQWRDVESQLRHVGVAIELLSGARIKVTKEG